MNAAPTNHAIVKVEAQASTPADRNPANVYLASLAPGSRRTMAQALRVVVSIALGAESTPEAATDAQVRELPWPALRYQHTAAIRAAVAERYSPAMANKVLCALRGVLSHCRRLGLMTAEDCAAACDIQTVRGQSLAKGRHISAGEIGALFAACDATTPRGARDAAMLALLRGGGLRREELINLDVSDFTPADGALRVRGKGHKERLVYATNGCLSALQAWLSHRGTFEGPLFLRVSKANQVVYGQRLTTQAIWHSLMRLAAAAGVPHLSPHDFRRTFASDLLDSGADIVTIQNLMGHASVVTTARYDRRGEATKRRAAEMIHIPFNAPTPV